MHEDATLGNVSTEAAFSGLSISQAHRFSSLESLGRLRPAILANGMSPAVHGCSSHQGASAWSARASLSRSAQRSQPGAGVVWAEWGVPWTAQGKYWPCSHEQPQAKVSAKRSDGSIGVTPAAGACITAETHYNGIYGPTQAPPQALDLCSLWAPGPPGSRLATLLLRRVPPRPLGSAQPAHPAPGMTKDETPVEYGYCQCGCGQRTKISPQNYAKYGHVRGEPRRFLAGHHSRLPEYQFMVQRAQRAAAAMPRPPVAVAFWSKVQKGPGCWTWTAAVNRTGYGAFHVPGTNSRVILAPRMAWELTYGSILPGFHILHRCDNPSCVRPSHLFLGDHAMNMRDAAQKNRFPRELRSHNQRERMKDPRIRAAALANLRRKKA